MEGYGQEFSLDRSYRHYTWRYELGSYDPAAGTCRVLLGLGGRSPQACEFGLFTAMVCPDGMPVDARDLAAVKAAIVEGMYETFGIKDAPHDRPGVARGGHGLY